MKSGASSPSTTTDPSSRRAIGVVRVSRVGARSGETFVSPSEQRNRIEQACARDGLELVDVLEELDVSGGAPLARRHGLRRAVELVEAGDADVVVVAYLDRLVRSLTVQAEVVSRVEDAGGAILAVDVGQLTNGSSAQWLSGTLLGAVSEYARRVTAERTADAKRRAVERGVPPFPNVPPGYRRSDGGRLEPDPELVDAVADAFRLRAGGATVAEVRDHLRAHGIERSYHGTQAILGSRIYLGELTFGKLTNPASHVALVDAETWARVQRMRSPRGRRPKSDRLLARLDVLRCATCGARMVIGSTDQKLAAGGTRRHWFYRCPPVGDCPRRVTISADVAERVVVDAVKELLRDTKASASVGGAAEQAERDLALAEADLDAAVEAFSGLDDVATARRRLLELRDVRDTARDRLAELETAIAPAVTLTVDDWEKLTLDEQRALIRAVIDQAVVEPGKGAERVKITIRGAPSESVLEGGRP